MKKIFVISGLAGIIIINSGCPKACIETDYTFSVSSQITPDSDSVHVGDTIFLTSSFPTKLTDQSSGVMIEYSNSTNVGSTFGLVKLIDGIYPGKNAVNNFNYISITGSIYNREYI